MARQQSHTCCKNSATNILNPCAAVYPLAVYKSILIVNKNKNTAPPAYKLYKLNSSNITQGIVTKTYSCFESQ